MVLSRLHEERFKIAHQPLFMRRCSMKASISADTHMYRLLDEHGEVRERRDQLTHPSTRSPNSWHRSESTLELGYNQATGASEMDVLLLVRTLDVFSRYVTGWMVDYRESAELEAIDRGELQETRHQPGQLSLHADRGTSMRSNR